MNDQDLRRGDRAHELYNSLSHFLDEFAGSLPVWTNQRIEATMRLLAAITDEIGI